MQGEQSSLRRQIYYTTRGYLKGPSPKGPILIVWHQQVGKTGFRLYWKDSWQQRFRQEDLYRLFGISASVKKSGDQKGYTSEAAIRAVWRYLTDRYNESDSDVTYSKSEPDLTKAAIRTPSQLEPSDHDLSSAVQLAATWHRSGAGESEAHKALKNRIAEHPEFIGVTEVTSVAVEYPYPSGDRVDLLFESNGSRWTVVEVELEGLAETVSGLFQAVKYRALHKAVLCTEKRQGSVSAILAARSIPLEVRVLSGMLDVATIEVPEQVR